MAVDCAHLMGSGFVPRKWHIFGMGGLNSEPALICLCLSLLCSQRLRSPGLSPYLWSTVCFSHILSADEEQMLQEWWTGPWPSSLSAWLCLWPFPSPSQQPYPSPPRAELRERPPGSLRWSWRVFSLPFPPPVLRTDASPHGVWTPPPCCPLPPGRICFLGYFPSLFLPTYRPAAKVLVHTPHLVLCLPIPWVVLSLPPPILSKPQNSLPLHPQMQHLFRDDQPLVASLEQSKTLQGKSLPVKM